MRLRKKKWAEPLIKEYEGKLIFTVNNESEKIPNTFTYSKENINILEIGIGKGDFINNLAIKNPNNYYYGVEMSSTIIAVALKKAIQNQVDNVKLININANSLEKLFKSKTFDKIHLNFSDPWPKKRHQNRRLTSMDFLKMYSTLLKNKGQLIIKTDNLNLFEFSVSNLKQSNWTINDINYDYPVTNNFEETMTEYEQKFRQQGKKIYFLKAAKAEVL